jgi:5'-3' exonuclease
VRVVVDGNHIATRARHGGLVLRSRSDGKRTATLYGFLTILAGALRTLKATNYHTSIFFDGGHSAYRKALYPGYKQKERTPEEQLEDMLFREQVNLLRTEFLPAMGLASGSLPGVEADDLIAVVARKTPPSQYPCVIVSGDSDFGQLVTDERIHVLNADCKLIREAEVLEKWGTTGDGVALSKAFIGDTSDKVKGVAGIGKQRVKLLIPYFDMILEQCRKRQNGSADPAWSLPTEFAEQYAKITNMLLAGLDTLDRNLKLIRLPEYFDHHFPDVESAATVCDEVLTGQRNRNMVRFVTLCREWEIDDVIPMVMNAI